jgi:ABC-type microcin C transport system duplicated ATPase subunit YejF
MNRSDSPLLDIRNLSVDFRTDEGLVNAVSNVSLRIRPGQVMGLVGESGSGKSVTAKTIMRLTPGNAIIKPQSHIGLHHAQQDLNVLKLRGSALKLVRGGVVSMIFQEPMASFAPAIRIGHQIIQTMQIHLGYSQAQARKKGIELFERVGIPEPARRFDQYVFELSGGMRQRAMIAMALSTNPRLLIADEPTTALDVTIQAQVLDLMQELREQLGMAMLFITHDLGVISKIADEVTVMQQGRVVEAGQAEHVLYAPNHAYTKRLIDALPHPENLPEPPVIRPMPLIRIRDLSITYPISGPRRRQTTFTAVNGISLDLPVGEITGLVGESGSGKTSLGKALLAATPISHGTIDYLSVDDQSALSRSDKAEQHHGEPTLTLSATRKVNRKALSKKAQLVFQDPYSSLNPRMTVRDIIAEPLEAMKLTRSRAETDQRVIEMAQRCHLEVRHLRRFPHAFSGGQRQRISIARALICQPQFLVADESVAALDVSIQAEILTLLKTLRADLGLTVLFISHDLSVSANLCDRVCVMKQGQLIEQGSVKQIFTNPQHSYTRQLITAIPLLEKPPEFTHHQDSDKLTDVTKGSLDGYITAC